jgi:hypothetical protein
MNQWNYGMPQSSPDSQSTELYLAALTRQLPSFQTNFQSSQPVGGSVFATPQSQTTASSLAPPADEPGTFPRPDHAAVAPGPAEREIG